MFVHVAHCLIPNNLFIFYFYILFQFVKHVYTNIKLLLKLFEILNDSDYVNIPITSLLLYKETSA